MNTLQVDPGSFGQVSFEGQRSFCIGSVSDGGKFVYLSMVGFKTANRALWAALMEKRNALQIGHQTFRRLDGKYVHDEKPLPEIAMSHMILLHSQASVTESQPDKPFYIVGKDENHFRFYALLNRALALPLLPEWTDYLWEQGREEMFIKTLVGQGAEGFIVEPDAEFWSECVTDGIKEGNLR